MVDLLSRGRRSDGKRVAADGIGVAFGKGDAGLQRVGIADSGAKDAGGADFTGRLGMPDDGSRRGISHTLVSFAGICVFLLSKYVRPSELLDDLELYCSTISSLSLGKGFLMVARHFDSYLK